MPQDKDTFSIILIIQATFLFLFLFTPFHYAGALVISEVAWMGTVDSSLAEWLEIYNDSNENVSLDGFSIFEKDDAQEVKVIDLSGTIPAGSFWVVRRVTASISDPFPDISGVSGSFGGSGLKNTGEHLLIKNISGTILHSLDASAGWPAGNNSTKETMQLVESGWISATSTPGAPNSALIAGVFVESSDLSGSGANSSFVGSTEPSRDELSGVKVDVGRESRLVVVGRYEPFIGELKKGSSFLPLNGPSWSFGDGSYFVGSDARHAYFLPGGYTAVFSASWGGHNFTKKVAVQVVLPNVAIGGFGEIGGQKFIILKNNSTFDVDLSGWKLSSGSDKFIFPSQTFLSAGALVRFPYSVTKIKDGAETSLTDSTGRLYSRFSREEPTVSAGSDESGKLKEEIVREAVDARNDNFLVMDESLSRLMETARGIEKSILSLKDSGNYSEKVESGGNIAATALPRSVSTSTKVVADVGSETAGSVIVIPKRGLVASLATAPSRVWSFLMRVFK